MPNHITNQVEIVGTDKQVQEVKKFMRGKENPFDFENVIPMPELSGDGWYDWSINHWGTKWNSYDHEGFEDDGDEHIEFDTAWSHPEPIMIALSKEFPKVTFNIRWADEDMGYNVGSYTLDDGVESNLNQPDGGSLEAYEMALAIKGGEDYYLGDIFDDYEEGESDDFIGNMIRLSVMEGGTYINDSYPKWVLERAKEIAIELDSKPVLGIIEGVLGK